MGKNYSVKNYQYLVACKSIRRVRQIELRINDYKKEIVKIEKLKKFERKIITPNFSVKYISPFSISDEDATNKECRLEEIITKRYYQRHFRALKRERIFYSKLQQWRQKGENHKKDSSLKMTLKSLKGPWEFTLTKKQERIPSKLIDNTILQLVFNYHHQTLFWKQPIELIEVLENKKLNKSYILLKEYL